MDIVRKVRQRSGLAILVALATLTPLAPAAATGEIPGLDLNYGTGGGHTAVDLPHPVFEVSRISVSAGAYELGSVDGMMAIGAMAGVGVASDLTKPQIQHVAGTASDSIRPSYGGWLIAGTSATGSAVVASVSGLGSPWGTHGVLTLPVEAVEGSVRFVDSFHVSGISADNSSVWIAAITSAGDVETAFGVDGVRTIDFGPGNDALVATAWPFVVGFADGATRVAKINGNGQLDLNFAVGGMTTLALPAGADIRTAQLQQSVLFLGGVDVDGAAYLATMNAGDAAFTSSPVNLPGAVIGFGNPDLGMTRTEIVVADSSTVRLATVSADGTLDQTVPVVEAAIPGALEVRARGGSALIARAHDAVQVWPGTAVPPATSVYNEGWAMPESPQTWALAALPDGSALVAGTGRFGAWLFSLGPDGTPGGPLGAEPIHPPSVAEVLTMGAHSDHSFTLVSSDVSATYLTRFLANGTIDRSYGDFGLVSLPGRARPGTVMLAPDGSATVVTSRAYRVTAGGVIDPDFGLVSPTYGSLDFNQRHPFFARRLPTGNLQVYREGAGHLDVLELTSTGDVNPATVRSLFGGYGPVRGSPVATSLADGSLAIAMTLYADPLPTMLHDDGATVDMDVPIDVGWPCSPRALAATTDGGVLVSCTDTFGGVVTKLRKDFSVDHGFGFDGVLDGEAIPQFAPLGGDRFLAAGSFGANWDAVVLVSRLRGDEPPVAQPARYVALATPIRLVDTRGGTPIEGGTVRDFAAAGTPGIPATATALATNVAVVGAPGSGGFGQLFGVGMTTPGSTSTVNFRAGGGTVSSFTTVRVGPSGAVAMYLSATAHVVIDVYGYWVPAGISSSGRFVAEAAPRRLLDTRTSAGGKRRLAPNEIRTVATQRAGATAAVVNVTVTQPLGSGWLTAYGNTLPPTSSTNFIGAETRANLAIVPLRSDGTLRIKASTSTHVIIDIVGYITGSTAPSSSTGLFVAESPTRLVDTRYGLGIESAPDPGASTQLWVSGTAGIPDNAAAVLVTLVSVRAPVSGWLDFEVSPAAPHNTTSVLNVWSPGGVVSNSAVAAVGNGGLAVYTTTGGDIIIDAWGWFTGP